jgi:cell division protein FtsX
MSNIQDLEQEFLRCWEITQDLDLLAKENENNDALKNNILGIKNVYEMRFNKAWDTYEALVKEYYGLQKYKPRAVNFDNEENEDAKP